MYHATRLIPEEAEAVHAEGLRLQTPELRYKELVAKHPRLDSVVIPIRDGLSFARVKG